MASRKHPASPFRRPVGEPLRKKIALNDREPVEVVCRLCPLRERADCPCAYAVDENTVQFVPPADFVLRSGQRPPGCQFKFSYVFDESDGQRAVFDRVAVDLVENLLRGKSSLLFAYGVSGSGKTYTMTGDPSEKNSGVLPRTLDVLFNSVSENLAERCVFESAGPNGFRVATELRAAFSRRLPNLASLSPMDDSLQANQRFVETRKVSGVSDRMLYGVFVSYIEVYNDACYDLLETTVLSQTGQQMMRAKELRVGANKMSYVDGVTELEVRSSDEALKLFCKGQAHRSVGDTVLNKLSSRSHTVFTVRLVMAPCQSDAFHPDMDLSKVVVAQLSLVDLAGSERTKRTCNEGIRLVETGKINTSLLVLRQCFDKLRENQKRPSNPVPVPYRDSKLTLLFRNFFEGSGKVRMLVCINPRAGDYAENLNVMTFAEASQEVELSKCEVAAVPTSDGLGRRDYIKWTNEINKVCSEARSSSHTAVIPLAQIDELQSSEDTAAIEKLRSFYKNRAQRREVDIQELGHQEEVFNNSLRIGLFTGDLLKVRIAEAENEAVEAKKAADKFKKELSDAREEIGRLNKENRRLKREKERWLEGVAKRDNDKQNSHTSGRKAVHMARERVHPSSPSRGASALKFVNEDDVIVLDSSSASSESRLSTDGGNFFASERQMESPKREPTTTWVRPVTPTQGMSSRRRSKSVSTCGRGSNLRKPTRRNDGAGRRARDDGDLPGTSGTTSASATDSHMGTLSVAHEEV